MKIQGHEVTQAQHATILKLLYSGPITTNDLIKAAVAAGVPHQTERAFVASRVVDSIVQKERRDGNIKLIKQKWHVAHPEAGVTNEIRLYEAASAATAYVIHTKVGPFWVQVYPQSVSPHNPVVCLQGCVYWDKQMAVAALESLSPPLKKCSRIQPFTMDGTVLEPIYPV